MTYKIFWERVSKLEWAYHNSPDDMKYIWRDKLYRMMLLVSYY